MYVCICHAVTDRQIAHTIAQGATTFSDLRHQLGVGSCCGKCGPDVRNQLRQQCTGQGSGCACAQQA